MWQPVRIKTSISVLIHNRTVGQGGTVSFDHFQRIAQSADHGGARLVAFGVGNHHFTGVQLLKRKTRQGVGGFCGVTFAACRCAHPVADFKDAGMPVDAGALVDAGAVADAGSDVMMPSVIGNGVELDFRSGCGCSTFDGSSMLLALVGLLWLFSARRRALARIQK